VSCCKRSIGLSQAEDREYQWWAFIESKLPSIAQAGFTALVAPRPQTRQRAGKSMGYDPYDYYDLGEFIQKGGVAHVGSVPKLNYST